MSDTTLNRFVASGLSSARTSFTPSPATPASGPNPGYYWFETDTGLVWCWNSVTPAWQLVAGGGGGIIVAAIQASENISAGAIVNVWNSSGPRIRNANATDNTKPANGFILASVTTGNNAIFFGSGQIITGLSTLTPGSTYFLDTSSGGINATAPSAAGNLVQALGVALSTTTLAFAPSLGVTL